MLKNILKTNGAQQLSKNELQTINGGGFAASTGCGQCNAGGSGTHCPGKWGSRYGQPYCWAC